MKCCASVCIVFLRARLGFLQMPDELIHDQDVIMLREEISGYQQMFVELHKESEKFSNINRCDTMHTVPGGVYFLDHSLGAVLHLGFLCVPARDPQKLKQKITQMEEEKRRLHMLIKRASIKAEGERNSELFGACAAYRKQQDEQQNIQGQVRSPDKQFYRKQGSNLKLRGLMCIEAPG